MKTVEEAALALDTAICAWGQCYAEMELTKGSSQGGAHARAGEASRLVREMNHARDVLIAAARREAFIEAHGAAVDAALAVDERVADTSRRSRTKRAILYAEKRGCETYSEELESLQKEFDDKVDALAARVRAEVIIPACKRHGLKFLSGNGVFMFVGKRGKRELSISGEDDCILEGYLDLIPVFEVLNLEVGRNDFLGWHVARVLS